MSSGDSYTNNVFINCPFDAGYQEVMNAIVFAVMDCGFRPRCAAEIDDGSEVRLDKIYRIIQSCKYAVHDLCRTELSPETNLPRFNMPLELGIFLGSKKFRVKEQKEKCCVILDVEPYRYQQFISDIAGQDIKAHGGDPERAVRCVSDWLRIASRRASIPGGASIWAKYTDFKGRLPDILAQVNLTPEEMMFVDLTNAAWGWLTESEADP